MSKEADKYLKEFNGVIQACPICGKIDAYKGDNHNCGQEIIWQQQEENSWN